MLKKKPLLISVAIVAILVGVYFAFFCNCLETSFKESLPRQVPYANWTLEILPEGKLNVTAMAMLASCVTGSGSWKFKEETLFVLLKATWKCEPNEPEAVIDPPQVVEEDLRFRVSQSEDQTISLELISQ